MSGSISGALLRIHLVTAGEPLVDDRPDIRLHRTGQLALWLAARGHYVTWVTNRFDHFRKVPRSGPDSRNLVPNCDLVMLPSRGYRRNVSLQRLQDHADLGRAFRERTPEWSRPDVVVAAMPTIELAYESVAWAKRVDAASIVDIRDLWPEVLIERVPTIARWAARVALRGLQAKLDAALEGADAIVAPNVDFVKWGCARGHRRPGPLELELPLGYQRRELSEGDRAGATNFWTSHGVRVNDATSAVLVFAGSLSSQFNFQPVLDAADLLAGEGVQIVFCGTGEQFAPLRQAAGERRNIVVPGWCSYGQLRVLMESAVLGLMPYRQSTNFSVHIPNKAAEYVAHGLPLAWSLGTGPLSALIAERGLGVSYRDQAVTLADYVRRLCADPGLRSSIREKARAVFVERFEAEAIHQRFERLLRQLAEHRKAG